MTVENKPPTKGCCLAWRRMKDDFVALWNARAAQADEGARGNFLFVLLLAEMARFANYAIGYRMYGQIGSEHWKAIDTVLSVPADPGLAYERMELSRFAFNGPAAGLYMDSPGVEKHLTMLPDGGIYLDLRQLFKALVEAVDPLMEGSADGV